MARGKASTSEKPKAPVGRRSIFADDQLAYLRPFVPAYVAASGPRIAKGEPFWNSIFPGFFERWPVTTWLAVDYTNCKTEADRAAALDAAIEAAMQQMRNKIKAWFTRQTQSQNEKKTWKRHLERITRPLKGIPRKFSDKTMYKFYGAMDEYKDNVLDEMQQEAGSTQVTRATHLSLWCKTAKRMWAEEPDDVREAVAEAANEEYEDAMAAQTGPVDLESMSEEDREAARANLVGALQPWIDEVARIAGLTCATFIGGVPPTEAHPYVRTISVHTGTALPSKGGREFDKHLPKVYRKFVRAFGRFTEDTTDKVLAPIPEEDEEEEEEAEEEEGEGEEEEQGRERAQNEHEDEPRERQQELSVEDPLDSMIPFEGEGASVNAETPSIPPTTSAPAPSHASGASTTTPAITDATQRTSTSTAAAPQATGPESHPRPAAPSTSASTAASGAEPRTSQSTPSMRPRPKPPAYETPASFDSYQVKGAHLNDQYRALLQRLPGSERESKLNTMLRWDAPTFTKANKLAEEDAQLGRHSSERDAKVLKEIFKYWDWTPKPAESATQGKKQGDQTKAASKRKLSEVDEDDYRGSDDDESAGEEGPSARPRRSTRRKTAHTAPLPDVEAPPPPAARDRSKEAGPSRSARGSQARPTPASRRTRRMPPLPSSSTTELCSSLGRPPASPSHSQAQSHTSEGPRSTRAAPADSLHTPHLTPSPPPRAPSGAPTSSTRGLFSVSPGPEHVPALHEDIGPAQDVEMEDGTRLGATEDPVPPAAASSAPTPSIFADNGALHALPPWMQTCVKNIKDLEVDEGEEDLHAAYMEVANAWAELEKLNGHSEKGKKLRAGNCRPSCVKAWIKRARHESFAFDVLHKSDKGESDDVAAAANFAEFRLKMREWWHAMNPSWRAKTDTRFALGRGDGDLSPLYCTGQNGLISLVVCLKWWWDILGDPLIDEKEAGRAEWREAVDDIAWTLKLLVEQQRAQEHLGTNETSSTARPTKRRKT